MLASSPPRRRIRLVLLTFLGFVVVAAGAEARSLLTPPPSTDSPQSPVEKAQPVPKISDVPNEGTTSTNEDLKAERRRIGNLPLDEQVRRVSSETGRSEQEVWNTGTVVMTLEHPMPLDVFDRFRTEDRLPRVVSATAYAELENGYPFRLSGPPHGEFRRKLSSFMANAADRFRDTRPGPESRNGSGSSQPPDREQAAAIEERRQELDDTAVIIGFLMQLDEFKGIEAEIRERFDFAATEVTLGGGSPFKGVDDALTPKRVEGLRSFYTRKEP